MLDIYGYIHNSIDTDTFEKFIEDAGIELVDPAPEPPSYKFVDKVVPFPKHNRFGSKTSLHVFNEMPLINLDDEFRANQLRYIVREDKELDFWNEIRGFFVANENGGVIVHDVPEFELPTEDGVRYVDATEKDLDSLSGWAYNAVVGDRIVTSDYKVYTVIGFNHSSGEATVYGDVQ